MPAEPRSTLQYANCWEDADLLLDRIGDIEGRRVLSISSGGENSLSLLSRRPGLLAVVDRNPAQIFLFELKRTAMRVLEREDFLAFLGYSDARDRWGTYRLLRDRLEDGARAFWDRQRKRIAPGVVHTGATAVRLRFFSRFVRPLIHNEARSRELMAPKTGAEQARFYSESWDNRRWRAMGRALFCKPALFFVSPDRDFMTYYKGDVSGYLLEKTARHFSTTAAQQNHMLHYFLFGSFGRLIPHYVREENYALIRENLGAAVTHAGPVETALTRFGRFDGFNLSNIFEYTTPGSFRELAGALAAGANPSALFAHWNILLPRKLSEAMPYLFENLFDTSIDRGVPDKGWIYSRFLLERRGPGGGT
jgi:S-adenosylmethionine-diacylglycerol 3-amino-3-carboxypropyl transferase